MFKGRIQLLRALALALCVGSVSAQKIINLPTGSWANDITPDGEVVVGTFDFGNGFIWRWRVDPAPTVILGGDVVGVSDDGSVVCGNIPDPGNSGASVAAIWTAASGWQSLGWLPTASLGCGDRSSAYDISGDGTTVVGLSWVNGCNARGFRWTSATGMQELQGLANGSNRCSAISGDGSALGGFAQGTFSRTPAYWAPNTSGFVLDANFQGEVHGFNENGSKSVGTKYFSGSSFTAFIRDAQTGVMTNLGGLLGGNWAGTASDLSEDNKVIVGYDVNQLSRKAWVWTSTDGIKSLNDRLTALGVVGAPNLLVCRAVSDDGNVVVGGGEAGGGGPFGFGGFIVEFNTPSPQWTDLGNGLAGTQGIPKLVGTGALTAGSPTSVVLTKGKPSSPAAYVVGISTIYASFKQGVLVPFPDYLVLVPALAPSGSVGLPFTWPAGVPGGVSLYWQCLISDPVGPSGFAISNALQSTTP